MPEPTSKHPALRVADAPCGRWRPPVAAFVAGVVAGAGGIWAWGRWHAGASPSARPAEAEDPPPRREVGTASSRPRLAWRLPVGDGRPATAVGESGGACVALLRRCLAECGDEPAQGADRFAGAPAAERPERWTRTVPEAVQACGIPGELLDVDCDRYPCVAAVRIDATNESTDTVRDHLRRAWAKCPELVEKMGWAPDDPHRSAAGDVEVFASPECPESKVAVLLAFAPDGPVARAERGDVLHDDAAMLEWVGLQGRIAERLAALERKWRCE